MDLPSASPLTSPSCVPRMVGSRPLQISGSVGGERQAPKSPRPTALPCGHLRWSHELPCHHRPPICGRQERCIHRMSRIGKLLCLRSPCVLFSCCTHCVMSSLRSSLVRTAHTHSKTSIPDTTQFPLKFRSISILRCQLLYQVLVEPRRLGGGS
jgi:hypothetical protein